MIPEQPFVLSHGDPTGYGFHGDFFNGWDDGVLQRALDDCDGADGANKSSGEAKTCKHFTLQDKDASDKCTKKFLSSPDVGNGETVSDDSYVRVDCLLEAEAPLFRVSCRLLDGCQSYWAAIQSLSLLTTRSKPC